MAEIRQFAHSGREIDEVVEKVETKSIYTAGDNVSISDGVISATDTTYTAGDNITIVNGVISATDTTYTAGDNVSITDGVISATDTTYTAGDNITITDGVISATSKQLYLHQIHYIQTTTAICATIYAINDNTDPINTKARLTDLVGDGYLWISGTYYNGGVTAIITKITKSGTMFVFYGAGVDGNSTFSERSLVSLGESSVYGHFTDTIRAL